MADFVTQSTVKSAVRELTSPITDVATFAGSVQTVLSTNSFGCTAYETSSGPMPATASSQHSSPSAALSRPHSVLRIVFITDDHGMML